VEDPLIPNYSGVETKANIIERIKTKRNRKLFRETILVVLYLPSSMLIN